MNISTVLLASAAIELIAGAVLLTVPSLGSEILLGAELSSPQALVVARVAGAGLVSLAVACWLGRNAERRGQSGLVAAMLVYNGAVPLLLVHGWTAGLRGLGLWPATVLHALLAVWCGACLWRALKEARKP